jgi:2'-5' RNA ligase
MSTTLTSHWNRSWGPGPQRRLHWYVVPPASLHDHVGRVQAAVERPELRPIPGPWLHCTVQSVRNTADVSKTEIDALLDTARSALSSFAPFMTSPGAPAMWGEAVVFDLSPSPELVELHQVVVGVSCTVLDVEAPARFVPHVTFSYAHADGDAATTVEALRDPAFVLPPFAVQRLLLLDVLREPGPERGWYSWDVVGEIALPSRA